jgi:hypothetical protein
MFQREWQRKENEKSDVQGHYLVMNGKGRMKDAKRVQI